MHGKCTFGFPTDQEMSPHLGSSKKSQYFLSLLSHMKHKRAGCGLFAKAVSALLCHSSEGKSNCFHRKKYSKDPLKVYSQHIRNNLERRTEKAVNKSLKEKFVTKIWATDFKKLCGRDIGDGNMQDHGVSVCLGILFLKHLCFLQSCNSLLSSDCHQLTHLLLNLLLQAEPPRMILHVKVKQSKAGNRNTLYFLEKQVLSYAIPINCLQN